MNVVTHSFDALIVGGGAAGLMCAITAGKRGRRVAVLERAERAGKKILISGGGRCKFTNLHCGPENFFPPIHISLSLRSRATRPRISSNWSNNIASRTTKRRLGQFFCDRSANDILAMLLEECRLADVAIFLGIRSAR